ncbi:hypothetical protein Q3G72_003184 [Acer saccharum]|nr:hypothetical protein Q3G72_003184 [Acer saccharum]
MKTRVICEIVRRGLLFQNPKSEQQSGNTLIQHLKSSLSRTLDLFAPLTGRFATIKHVDNAASFFIECNNEGAQFVHAAADGVCVADVIQPIHVPKIVYSFFPLNGVVNYEGTSKPLLAVQITELVDGIFIGTECLSTPTPILERWFLHDKDCPIHIPLFTSEQLNNRYAPPYLEKRVFHFSKENVAKLKAKANVEIGTNKISSIQALLGHFFRSLVRNTSIDHPDQEMNIRFPVGLRPRMDPPLPQQYFGKADWLEMYTLEFYIIVFRHRHCRV